MSALIDLDTVATCAPAGYYIALRIGFACPVLEINELPPAWVDEYTANSYLLQDPVFRWVYTHSGAVRWSELAALDPDLVLMKAQKHGLRYGLTVCIAEGAAGGARSYGSFARSDREFTDLEIRGLSAYLRRRHQELAAPNNLTPAELEALRMVKDGNRLKEIAFELGVTEGAVKQRLKNAKTKLAARTSTQAAATAAQHKLI